jgi:DNA-binding MarR family transcriptional regulator
MSMPTHPALAGFTGFLLRKVATASFDGFSEIAAEHGLHPMHFGMLTILDAEGPVSQQELGRRAGVDPSTMVARIDALEQLGYVERRRSETDRRAYELFLTPEGQRVRSEMGEAATKWAEHFFRGLDTKERREFHALLAKLAATVDEDTAPAHAKEPKE